MTPRVGDHSVDRPHQFFISLLPVFGMPKAHRGFSCSTFVLPSLRKTFIPPTESNLVMCFRPSLSTLSTHGLHHTLLSASNHIVLALSLLLCSLLWCSAPTNGVSLQKAPRRRSREASLLFRQNGATTASPGLPRSAFLLAKIERDPYQVVNFNHDSTERSPYIVPRVSHLYTTNVPRDHFPPCSTPLQLSMTKYEAYTRGDAHCSKHSSQPQCATHSNVCHSRNLGPSSATTVVSSYFRFLF